MTIDYYEKYLKYKAKYLELQKQLGGAPFRIECQDLNGNILQDKSHEKCKKIFEAYTSLQLETLNQNNEYELYGLKFKK